MVGSSPSGGLDGSASGHVSDLTVLTTSDTVGDGKGVDPYPRPTRRV